MFVTQKIFRGYREISELHSLIWMNEIDAFFCGGYVRYMCSPNIDISPPSDIDIYSKDLKEFNRLVVAMKEVGFHIKLKSNQAITFYPITDHQHQYYCTKPIQLIRPIGDKDWDLRTTLEQFDFSVVCCGLIDDEEALVHESFTEDELHKNLRFVNIKDPLVTLSRVGKYLAKGYTIESTELVKVFEDWDGRSPEYKETKKTENININYKCIPYNSNTNVLEEAIAVPPDRFMGAPRVQRADLAQVNIRMADMMDAHRFRDQTPVGTRLWREE